MSRTTSASFGSDAAMTEASLAILQKGGSSVDACVGGFFAAAGAHPGVLLGSTVLLVGGTGVGFHVFDGSLLQPGKGAPRPRGFRDGDEVPTGSRIAVSPIGALLAAIHAHGGNVGMSELANAGVRVARLSCAPGRASLLRRVGSAGPIALRETSFARAMLGAAGRAEGGNVTPDDLNEVSATVSQPVLGNDVVSIAPPTVRLSCPAVDSVMVVACDHQGVFAVLHTAFDPDGLEIDPFEVTASRFAVPVRRGVPWTRPGTLLSMQVPIAILTKRGVPWASIAFNGASPVSWERLVESISPGLTLD
ncbi:MAG: hypothetical protein CSA75_04880, partial [Sorangium cellulosum]